MSLSSLIVQRDVATMRQVEEALARQVIYGGDLATNLLEVARVDEAVLTALLAESMQLAPAPPGELPAAPDRVRSLVPPEMALERSIVPLAVENNRLVVAVAEPLPADLVDQLSFALGMAIEQRAAPAVRVRQAIGRTYGVQLERRMQRLVAQLEGHPSATGSMPPPLGTIPAVPEPPRPPSAPPRTGTPAYGMAAMHAGLGTPAGTVPQPRAVPPVVAVTAPAPVRMSAPELAAVNVPAPAPAPAPQPTPDVDSDADADGDSDAPAAPFAGDRRAGLLQREVVAGARASRRRRGPITLETAKHEAEEAPDRDALLDLYFDFARQFFDYAALFLVHGDIAEGRDAFGDGASRDKVVGIGVPLDLPSVMASARDKRAPVVARVAADGLDGELLADLQRPRSAEIAIVPLVVRTRAVALLVGDCGDASIDRASVQQVIGFSGVIGKAFERLIVRRKLAGFIAGSSKGSSVGRVDASQVEAKPPSLAPAAAPPLAPAPSPAAAPPAERIPSGSSRPPPAANIASVRSIAGPPIPREDPGSEPPPDVEVTKVARPARAESAARARGRTSTSQPPRAATPPPPRAATPQPPAAHARGEDPALFDELGWQAFADDEVPPPVSSAIAVPPHTPPPPRPSPTPELPKVIVNIDDELQSIVDRLLAGEADETGEGELLRQGERAMRVLMARFPGPLTVERSRIAIMAHPPRPSDCGALLRLIVRERKVALPFVLERLDSPDPEVRGWATHLLCELPYTEGVPYLLARLRDADAATRASAAHALAAAAKLEAETVREALVALAHAVDPTERAAAMRAMGELRDGALVPELVRALGDGDEAAVAAAHEALVRVTRADFGTDARPWLRWWEQNSGRHRIEWLIDALTHEVSEMRRAAGEELRATTKEYFGYASDLPARDRERAQQRYRDWWITEGRARFRRPA